MRVVFMGSPALAVPSLDALIQAGHDVSLAVTQPPRPGGRGRHEIQPPIAVRAAELGIPIFQPERLRAPSAVARVAAEQPLFIVVAAYGQIVPSSVLALPQLGSLNVHPSFLPRHRGAAPISGAILAGDPTTGVTIMLMDEGLDTGPILAQAPTPIADDDDQISLSKRLANMAASLLIVTMAGFAAGSLAPQPQNEQEATLTRRATVADGDLDWTLPAVSLWRRVRAFAEWPQARAWWKGRLIHILRASYDPSLTIEPGLVVAHGPPRRAPIAIAIGTGRGALLPEVVELGGRRPMPIADFLRGARQLIGARLESSSGQGE